MIADHSYVGMEGYAEMELILIHVGVDQDLGERDVKLTLMNVHLSPAKMVENV